MLVSKCLRPVFLFLSLTILFPLFSLRADNTPQTIPFTQDWSDGSLITATDDWSGVAGITGYRGDGLTASTGTDPQTITADETTVDVNANRSDPNTYATGGVTEFDGITDPVVALQGSGTADAPFLLITIDTTGKSNIRVQYNVRDIDGGGDDTNQQVALQYRVGTSGSFTNLAGGYIADATTGPNLATLVTPVKCDPAGGRGQPVGGSDPRHHHQRCRQ